MVTLRNIWERKYNKKGKVGIIENKIKNSKTFKVF